MRDLLITLTIFGLIPWIFMRPHIGALTYAWLGLMNPHRLAWGFAYTFPFSTIVALVTIVSMFLSEERKKLPWTGTLVVWFLLIFWMNVTTFFALIPDEAFIEWDRTMKIQLMVLVTLLLMHGKERINAFVWVVTISIGFFGVKGGIFAILTGGQYLVRGPMESFITENNTLALALIMTLPLMRYLMVQATHVYVRMGLAAAMVLTTVSIVSSHSRGALLAGGTILVFLILKSRHKISFLIAAALFVPAILMFMPEAWFERMGTISEFERDASAMGRINAWWFAVNIANEYPITGGGFRAFSETLFLRFAPNPLEFVDAHSIYFEILGEHGYVGLGLFLLLGLTALRSCRWVIKSVREREELTWARDLAAMLQVSLIGYATGGAFLGLAYYDLYYNLIALVILLHYHVRQELKATVSDAVSLTNHEADVTMTNSPARSVHSIRQTDPAARGT